MNYSDYCNLKLNQCNFALTYSRSVSTPFGFYKSNVSTGTSAQSEAMRAANKAVNKAVGNLKTAIKNQVENKKQVDTSKANVALDANRLYEVEVGKEGTDIKPKLLNSNGFNKDRRDLATKDAKERNENKGEFSNTKVVVKSGNQVKKMMPEKYTTIQERNKEFHSNLDEMQA